MSTRRAALVAAVLAATLLAAAPAEAVPAPWTSAPCVAGELSEPEWDSGGQRYVIIGVATQCAPVVANGGFRIVTYRPDVAVGDAPGYNARRFPSATPGAMVIFGAAALPPRTAGNYGICLVAGENHRISCVSITVPVAPNPSVTVAAWPISTDAPLVAKDFNAGPYDTNPIPPRGSGGGIINTCGTCF
jgi:hypothetical protein